MFEITSDVIGAALRANVNAKLFSEGTPSDWVGYALLAAANRAGVPCTVDDEMIARAIEGSRLAAASGEGDGRDWCRAALVAAFDPDAVKHAEPN